MVGLQEKNVKSIQDLKQLSVLEVIELYKNQFRLKDLMKSTFDDYVESNNVNSPQDRNKENQQENKSYKKVVDLNEITSAPYDRPISKTYKDVLSRIDELAKPKITNYNNSKDNISADNFSTKLDTWHGSNNIANKFWMSESKTKSRPTSPASSSDIERSDIKMSNSKRQSNFSKWLEEDNQSELNYLLEYKRPQKFYPKINPISKELSVDGHKRKIIKESLEMIEATQREELNESGINIQDIAKFLSSSNERNRSRAASIDSSSSFNMDNVFERLTLYGKAKAMKYRYESLISDANLIVCNIFFRFLFKNYK